MDIKTIRDPGVISLVARIAEHYQTNIASRFIRPVLLQVGLDKPVWDRVEALTSKRGNYQEHLMEDLYHEIAAAAKFVAYVRRDLVPNIRNRVEASGGGAQEKIIRDMTVAAFPANINVFADYLNQLYARLVQLDEADTRNGRKPLYPRLQELIDLKRNLGVEG
ncbi:MAG: hypothetical protein LBC88_03030 [Spirochaetaceae bacterium]|jgi:hypothetical protein|nr:hypothetical protein [Spirochaetaceae bacterium]